MHWFHSISSRWSHRISFGFYIGSNHHAHWSGFMCFSSRFVSFPWCSSYRSFILFALSSLPASFCLPSHMSVSCVWRRFHFVSFVFTHDFVHFCSWCTTVIHFGVDSDSSTLGHRVIRRPTACTFCVVGLEHNSRGYYWGLTTPFRYVCSVSRFRLFVPIDLRWPHLEVTGSWHACYYHPFWLYSWFDAFRIGMGAKGRSWSYHIHEGASRSFLFHFPLPSPFPVPPSRMSVSCVWRRLRLVSFVFMGDLVHFFSMIHITRSFRRWFWFLHAWWRCDMCSLCLYDLCSWIRALLQWKL